MDYQIHEEGKFKYIESKGGAQNLLLLHGLFGALSNFAGIIDHFKGKYNVIIPILPIFDLPPKEVSLESLVEHINDFINYKGYEKVHLMGNSLGGHVGLIYTLKYQDRVASLTLTGSSGLYEHSIGNSVPPRANYEFVKSKTEATFYDPKVATKALVDEVYDIVNTREKTLAVIYAARSAIKHNVEKRLHEIKVPTLLVWGNEDTITPAFVGEKFHNLIADSKLIFMDECGHAAMMEHPHDFNRHLEEFLESVKMAKGQESE
ncbi:MAG: alpha/beta hydrolase [Bacteroidota bacterium]